MFTKEVKIGEVKIGGGNSLVLIAGPCVIESREQCLETAYQIKEICKELEMPFIFKSSYDKANRSSIDSFRGPGIEKGLEILEEVKRKFGVPVLSDVHSLSEIERAKVVLDVIQIPAFLCRQTDLLVRAGETFKVVNVKKGQFLAPTDVLNIIRKIESTGNRNILLTERGTSFGYHNLVSDLRALAIMREFGYPVVYDATHSVQLPGEKGKSSGGERKFVSGLARAGVAMGCDALFLEVHPCPDKALCDGPNMIDFAELKRLLPLAKEIDRIVKRDG
ncbi:MAG: 3-deoxy-8-phosphooctulonate synthase [Candidatus Omnitrophota bacterium]|nr:MAG: 3-deoxy-8-phosphooctulonate synthase [Candidatus Omnitrophota bacterium]